MNTQVTTKGSALDATRLSFELYEANAHKCESAIQQYMAQGLISNVKWIAGHTTELCVNKCAAQFCHMVMDWIETNNQEKIQQLGTWFSSQVRMVISDTYTSGDPSQLMEREAMRRLVIEQGRILREAFNIPGFEQLLKIVW